MTGAEIRRSNDLPRKRHSAARQLAGKSQPMPAEGAYEILHFPGESNHGGHFLRWPRRVHEVRSLYGTHRLRASPHQAIDAIILKLTIGVNEHDHIGWMCLL